MLIDGKEYIAEDIGGAIKGNVIDLYVGTEAESEVFGVRYVEVKVKEKKKNE